MDTFLVSRLPSTRLNQFRRTLEAAGGRFLGPEYDLTVRVVIADDGMNTVVSYGRNRNSPLDESIFVDRDLVVLFSGYIVDELGPGARWRPYFGSARLDQRPIRKSPGGIYSYASVRQHDGHVCAGHSIPTLEPMYYSVTEDGFHLGNHPLLVHVAAHDFGSPRLDETFILRAVGAGVAIDDYTPFVGTRRLPSGSVAVSSEGGRALKVVKVSEPQYGRYRLGSTRRRVESVSTALQEAGSILSRLPKGEFRLSGGKDSRLVAAYLKRAGIATTPVNQNFPSEVEGQAADLVASVLGTRCERTPIEDYVDRDVVRATARKVAFAGGLPAVASLQYPVRSEGRTHGTPLIMGHAHLQRGGFVNARVRTEAEALAAARSRTVNSYLSPQFAEHNSLIVTDFVKSQLSIEQHSVVSISFTAYLQYAMNYQFQSLYAYVRNWNLMITPLVDERFALLCKAIAHEGRPGAPGGTAGITDLRSERIAMDVTGMLAPELNRIPLARARYRCDNPGRRGYAARDPDALKQGEISKEDLKRVFNTRRLPPTARRDAWEQLTGGRVASFAEVAVRPEVWHYVSDPESDPPPGENPTLLNQFLLSLLGLSIIVESPWWLNLETS